MKALLCVVVVIGTYVVAKRVIRNHQIDKALDKMEKAFNANNGVN